MKRSTIVRVVLGISAILPSVCFGQTNDDETKRSEHLLDKGRSELILGKSAEAEKIARSVMNDVESRSGGKYARARLLLAEALLAQNDSKDAFQVLGDVDHGSSEPRERITFAFAAVMSGSQYTTPFTLVLTGREALIKKLIGDVKSLPSGNTKDLKASMLIVRSMFPEKSGDVLNDLQAADQLTPQNSALELMWGRYYLDQKQSGKAKEHLKLASQSKVSETAKIASDLLASSVRTKA